MADDPDRLLDQPLNQYLQGRTLLDADPLEEYGTRGPDRTLGRAPPPPRDEAPASRSFGKGSVQRLELREPTGQHNALWRIAQALDPLAAGYDIGHNILGPGIEELSPGQLTLGAGALGLAALPFGIGARARRPPPRAPEPHIRPPDPPPPLTGHEIGSLRLPRVPREVDPALGLYSAADEAARSYPRTAGTARDIQDWMHSQGVTAAEMQARGLSELFRDPRRTIPRQELLGHLVDNPIQLRSARYQGTHPEAPDLRAVSRAQTDEHGVWEHIIEDRRSGRMFTLIEDTDAGNIAVRTEAGNWLQVPGRTNNQRYDHGMQAIGEHLSRPELPPGVVGPVRYGPDQYPDLSLNARGNRTYAEDVLFAPPRLTPAQLRTREAAVTSRREELARLEAAMAREGGPNMGPATAALDDAQARLLEHARKAVPDPPRGFIDAHYPDQPNPIGWIRHSRQEAFERGPTGQVDLTRPPLQGVLWDELQMPMAQRIRDAGARNEARITELQARTRQLSDDVHATEREALDFLARNNIERGHGDLVSALNRVYTDGADRSIAERAFALSNRLANAKRASELATRELMSAGELIAGNPFVNDPSQALRTLMHYGLQNPALRDRNVSGIFLTPAQLQIERYNLARVVPKIGVESGVNGNRLVTLSDRNGGFGPGDGFGQFEVRPDGTVFAIRGSGILRGADGRQLSEVVGQDVAREIMRTAPGRHTIDTGSLEVGGRGMRENYDRIYPETLDAIFRRLDPRYPGRRPVNLSTRPLGWRDMPEWRESYPSYLQEPLHYFPFTDRIRAQLARGLPYFGGAGVVAAPWLLGRGEDDPLERYRRP